MRQETPLKYRNVRKHCGTHMPHPMPATWYKHSLGRGKLNVCSYATIAISAGRLARDLASGTRRSPGPISVAQVLSGGRLTFSRSGWPTPGAQPEPQPTTLSPAQPGSQLTQPRPSGTRGKIVLRSRSDSDQGSGGCTARVDRPIHQSNRPIRSLPGLVLPPALPRSLHRLGGTGEEPKPRDKTGLSDLDLCSTNLKQNQIALTDEKINTFATRKKTERALYFR